MIIVILQHFVRPGMGDVAKRRIDAMGNRMATMPGFQFRHAMVSCDDANKLVTLTAWASRAHYEGWLDSQRANAPSPVAASVEQTPYIRLETEVLSVSRSLPGTAT